MKILHIIDSFAAGGKERQLGELLKGLKDRRDITCRLVVLSNNIHYSYVKSLNLHMDIIPRRHQRDLGVFSKIYKIGKRFQPDIIHSWETMCSVYALPAAIFLNTRFVNGVIRSAPSKISPFSKIRVRSMLTFPFSDAILANSHAGLGSYKVGTNKGFVIHNGFDVSRIHAKHSQLDIRNKLNIKTPHVVGMVARFHERKDYVTYINSALNILKMREDVTFMAVGDGSMKDEFYALIPSKRRNRILFLGKQDDVESLINVFDIGVLVSHSEGISNAIMEYMAMGKPVIATNDGGTPEIVLHGKTGFLIKLKGEAELIDRIHYLLDNPCVAKEMGHRGKERILDNFNLKNATDKHIELYNEILLKPRRFGSSLLYSKENQN